MTDKDIDYSPFDGDGRYKRSATFSLPGTTPISVTNATARMILKAFLMSGHSNHSGQGGTLWVLLRYCQEHAIPYTLTAYPCKGYQVTRIADPVL